MLVLSRYPGQSVEIGEKINVKVVEVRGNRVRLGITAPEDTEIMRLEIIEGKESDVRNQNRR